MKCLLVAVVVAVSAVGTLGVPPALLAAAPAFYVDGRQGSDANDGRSPGSAFRTISKAAAALPPGREAAGWVVNVQGYPDYTYRERPIPTGWDRAGTASAPVVFRATGYVAGDPHAYVKPIVSGSEVVTPAAWKPSATAGVWYASWASAPFGFGTYSGSLRGALFQDETAWLWEQGSLSALASRANAGRGGFWYDASHDRLYASAIGQPGSGAQSPAMHQIDVVMRNGFLFSGTNRVAHVSVLGFDVRHTANGIAFVKGADYGTASDNVLLGNLLMGIQTSGGQTASGPNPSIGNVVERNTGYYNTLQFIKVDQGTQSSRFCNNTAMHNGLQGIKVQGAPAGSSYQGTTSSILICRNELAHNDHNPTGSTYNNASGLTIANGAKSITVDRNRIHDNDVGILVTQESRGRRTIDGTVLTRNEVYRNRRFGLYLFDGYQGASAGSGSLRSRYDVYWGNGIGVMFARGTSHKKLTKATIYANRGDGVRIGEAGKARATGKVSQSLLTHNRGYGLWLVSGNRGRLRYTGISSNGTGRIKGTPVRAALNFRAAGYLSRTFGAAAFLMISTTSFQYTAGPHDRPIGARW